MDHAQKPKPSRRHDSRWWFVLATCFMAFRAIAIVPPEPPRILIPFGATWTYYDGEAGQGIAWRNVNFDDSTWSSGPAPLGYGEGNLATFLDPDENRPITMYFRYQLELSDPLKISTMTLRLRRDDGIIVYVNGSEVMRNNMPENVVSFQTPAASEIEGIGESSLVQWGLWPGYFTSGINQIAVEVHQALFSLHDAAFDLELVANIPLTPPVINIVQPYDGAELPPGNILIQSAYADADGHLYRVDYFAGTNRLAEITEEPFSFLWPNVPAGRYILKALAIDHSGRRSFSEPVHIQVGNVLGNKIVRGPFLQSGSPTNITICWRTDWFANSLVRYGTQPDLLNRSVEDARAVIDHALVLENLLPDTRYYYAVGTDTHVLSAGLDHAFVTAPTNTRPVRIWVLGDSGTADEAARSVRDAYKPFAFDRATDLWLMLGDNAYEEGTDDEYQKSVFDMYPEMLRKSVLWPTIGNHELGMGNYESFAYLDIFHLPTSGQAGGLASGTERYYSFDYSNIHFVCLDSQTSNRFPGGAMQAWLEADLAATAKDWILAFWHHPPYSKGTHNSDTESQLIEMREQILPILESYGVDLVLCGHSHVYERSYLLNGHYGYSYSLTDSMILDHRSGRSLDNQAYEKPAGGLGAGQGTVYVVSGNAGQRGGFRDGTHPVMYFSHAGLGSLILDVDGQRLDCTYLTSFGSMMDSFTILKGMPSPDVRPNLRIEPAAQPNHVTLSWPTSPAPFYPEYTDPADPDQAWITVTNRPSQAGRRNVLDLDMASPAQWYRLRSD